ncbi:MAG TPA: hypothetical protein VFS43_28240 [Polyangiaceae bacterium]|nr:hypothetical protein [Polyangiaceae bacterium]
MAPPVPRLPAVAASLCFALLAAGCCARGRDKSSGVRFHAEAGKCPVSVSVKGPKGIVEEPPGLFRGGWTSKDYGFKTGDRVSFSVISVNCMREPTCNIAKDGVAFGTMRPGNSARNVLCQGVVP